MRTFFDFPADLMKLRSLQVLTAALFVSRASGACTDVLINGQPWHDSGGAGYSCAKYYTTAAKCAEGNQYDWSGYNAKQACCFCGGGETTAAAAAVGGVAAASACVINTKWEDPVYKDKCSDYQLGGAAYKYRCDEGPKQNCCSCATGTGTTGTTGAAGAAAASATCMPSQTWVHPVYKDKCKDYTPGGASWDYACDPEAAANCCSCSGGASASSSSSSSENVGSDESGCTMTPNWVHPTYADKCADYLPGGSSYAYACEPLAAAACCSCTSVSSAATSCTPNQAWAHPTYKDKCVDYAVGGPSAAYACDAVVVAACCTCQAASSTPAKVSANCVADKNWVHPSYDDKCVDYLPAGKSFQYQCEPEVIKACCTCASVTAAAIPAPPPNVLPGFNQALGNKPPPATGGGKGAPPPAPSAAFSPYLCEPNWTWKQETTKRSCDDYVYNAVYKNESCTDDVRNACCVCLGGDKNNIKSLWYSDTDAVAFDSGPMIDATDNILKEFVGPYRFRYKKHLAGGFFAVLESTTVCETTRNLLTSTSGQSDWLGIGGFLK